MSGRFIIYALVDPRDGAWRYIGQSSTGMERTKIVGYVGRTEGG